MPRFLVFSVLGSIFVSLVAIEEQKSSDRSLLQLKKLIDDVVKRNPDLAAAQARIKVATHVIPRVQTLEDPVFNFRTLNNPLGSRKKSEPQRPNRVTQGAPFEPQRRYRVTQKFPFIGKLRLRGEIAQHILEFAESEEIATYQELILQAKRLYFQLFFNKEARQINKQNRDIVSRFIDGAMAIYRVGKGSQADILKAQIELQILDDELLMLESDQETLISLLNALMNRPRLYAIGEVEEYFSPQFNLNYDQLESIAMREHPELQGLQALVEEQETRAQLARRDYYPDFSITLMVQNMPAKQTAWGVDIGFNLPIWIGSKQKQEVQEAEAEALVNLNRLANMRAQIRGRIRELQAKINASEERIVLYQTGLIPKINQTLASNESNYLVGKGDFLILLDTRRQLHNFQLDYERARVEREILFAELERELGISLEEVACSKIAVHFNSHQSLSKNKDASTLLTRKRKSFDKNQATENNKKNRRCDKKRKKPKKNKSAMIG